MAMILTATFFAAFFMEGSRGAVLDFMRLMKRAVRRLCTSIVG